MKNSKKDLININVTNAGLFYIMICYY